MRVRPQRQADRRLLGRRRPHAIGPPSTESGQSPPPAADRETPAPAGDEAVQDHVAERRHRAYVTPEDHALYRCQCGYQFEADVSASVACPHCGVGQAW
jgi:hypothetical protein